MSTFKFTCTVTLILIKKHLLASVATFKSNNSNIKLHF